MRAIVQIIDALNKVLRYFAAFLLAVMTVLITYQVVVRMLSPYMDVQLPRWTEELARYAMIWLVFVGTALAVRYSALIGMEAIAERLSGPIRKGLRLLVLLISMSLFVVMIIYGFQMITHVSTQLSPGLKISMAVPYAAIPFCGIFMLLNSIAVFIEVWNNETNRAFFKGSE